MHKHTCARVHIASHAEVPVLAAVRFFSLLTLLRYCLSLCGRALAIATSLAGLTHPSFLTPLSIHKLFPVFSVVHATIEFLAD